MKLKLNETITLGIILILVMAGVAYAQQNNLWTRPQRLERAYADMFLSNNTNATMIDAMSVAVNLSNMSVRQIKNMEFIPDRAVEIQIEGIYFIYETKSFSNDPNIEYHSTIGVNGIPQTTCEADRKIGASGDVGNTGSGCILDLEAGDQISLMIENVDNAADPTFSEASLNIFRIDD